jgi:hypothetical protein
MALQKAYQTVHGIDLPSAYIRVEGISFTSKTSMTFNVRFYNDKDRPFITEDQFGISYDIYGSNPYVQAYEHLKTLPEFAGAADV